LPVPDDEFPLAAADGNHGVDGLDPGLQGLLHRLPVNYPGGFPFQGKLHALSSDRTFSVQRVPDGVDHPTQQAFANFDRGNPPESFHLVPFAHFFGRTQQYGSDIVFFEVQHNSLDAALEFNHLVRFHIHQPIYTGNTVTHREDGSDLFEFCFGFESFYLLPEDFGYF